MTITASSTYGPVVPHFDGADQAKPQEQTVAQNAPSREPAKTPAPTNGATQGIQDESGGATSAGTVKKLLPDSAVSPNIALQLTAKPQKSTASPTAASTQPPNPTKPAASAPTSAGGTSEAQKNSGLDRIDDAFNGTNGALSAADDVKSAIDDFKKGTTAGKIDGAFDVVGAVGDGLSTTDGFTQAAGKSIPALEPAASIVGGVSDAKSAVDDFKSGHKIDGAFDVVSAAGDGLGATKDITSDLGKSLPGLGVAADVAGAASDAKSAVDDFKNGNVADGALDVVSTAGDGLGAAKDIADIAKVGGKLTPGLGVAASIAGAASDAKSAVDDFENGKKFDGAMDVVSTAGDVVSAVGDAIPVPGVGLAVGLTGDGISLGANVLKHLF